MVTLRGEIYLLAAEAARQLNVSRGKFYISYKAKLTPVKVGELNRKHYRLSDLEAMQTVRELAVAS